MPFKVSFFYTSQQELLGGWSENIWSSLSSFADVEAQILVIAPFLDTYHGKQTVLRNVRISTLNTKLQPTRLVKVLPQTFIEEAVNNTGADSDYVTTALLTELTGSTGQIVRVWYRGMPDGVVDKGGRYNPSWPGHKGKLANVRQQYITSSNGWRLRVNDAANIKIPVKAATGAGEITANGHGLVTNDKARLSGFAGAEDFNGVWRVTVTGPNVFTLDNFPPTTQTLDKGASPTVLKQSPVLIPIQDMTIKRATSHQTGRPFAQRTGRRRGRRS